MTRHTTSCRRRSAALSLVLLLMTSIPGIGEVRDVEGREALVMENEVALLVIDLAGGSIRDFHLLEQGLNPLQWDSIDFDPSLDDPTTTPRSMGHFLCLDRWGPASAAEIENGMGWHGEASRVVWKVSQDAIRRDGKWESVMTAQLPMAGLSITRTIRMAIDQALYEVREEVTNDRPLGRIYNMVQHPTIGPPFLDEDTVVDANGVVGFMQQSPLPNPEEPAVVWPNALTAAGDSVNLRHLTDDAEPAVVSYVIDEDFGWTTAANAGRDLLIGYLWKTEDYPWFDAWRSVDDGKPFARGLEFGTSGLHQPFPILVQKGKIFGRQTFVYIDAGETVTRFYVSFLTTLPSDFSGVDAVGYDGSTIALQGRDGSGKIKIASGALFK